jgi:tetratricopeptide (TPR) repeat protein
VEVEQTPLQKRFVWRDEGGAARSQVTFTARTQVRVRATLEAADGATGRILPVRHLEGAAFRDHHATSGVPFFPSVTDVREEALAQVQRELARMFTPWTETRRFLFFDDAPYGLGEARAWLQSGNPSAALRKALEAVGRARRDARAHPRILGRAHHNAGVCFLAVAAYDVALAYFQVAQDLDPLTPAFREGAELCLGELRTETPGPGRGA